MNTKIRDRAGKASAVPRAVAGILVLLSILTIATTGRASALTPTEKNMVVLVETAAFARSILQQEYGPTSDIINCAGTYSDMVWSLNVSGTYAGNAFSVLFSGTFNPANDTGTYNSLGTVAGGPWSGSGDWLFADVNATTVSMHHNMFEAFGPLDANVKSREKLQNTEQTLPDGTIKSTGSYYIVKNGVVESGPHPKSDTIPGAGAGTRRASIDLYEPQPHHAELTFDLTTSTFTGVVGVPEPASIAMAGLTLALLPMRRPRQRG